MAQISFYLQQSKAELFASRDSIGRQCFFLYKHYQFLNKEATEHPPVAFCSRCIVLDVTRA